MTYGPPADEKVLRTYTNGEAPDQFAKPRVGSRSSLLLVLFLQYGPYIVLANSEDPDQSARMRRLVWIFLFTYVLGPFSQPPYIPCESSDQPESYHSVPLKKQPILSYPQSVQQRPRSACANTQADLSFSWAHLSKTTFSSDVVLVHYGPILHDAVHIYEIQVWNIDKNVAVSDKNNIKTSQLHLFE